MIACFISGCVRLLYFTASIVGYMLIYIKSRLFVVIKSLIRNYLLHLETKMKFSR